MKFAQITLSTSLALASLASNVQAGPNDFFGGQIPSAPPGVEAAAGTQERAAASGDYTDDEKRMQKKYKSSLAHARSLIAKGEAMMKKSESSHNDKIFKKGKIIKEIGERRLAELQANNPFPNLKDSQSLKGKETQSTTGL